MASPPRQRGSSRWPGSEPGDLLTAEQRARAHELWAAGRTLADVARELNVEVYDLAPWLWRESPS